MTSPALEVRNVTYRYPDGTCALEDVSFTVGPDEAVALVGPSGAGKTTLMLCVVGFLELERGEIYVKGGKVGKKTRKQVRGEAGMIFQNADDQLFLPTVFEDVAFGLLNKGVGGEDLDRPGHRPLQRHPGG